MEDQVYKNMEVHFYQEKYRYIFSSCLSNPTSDPQWAFKFWDGEKGEHVWQGSLEELTDLVLLGLEARASNTVIK